jgi:hypothetical protein
MGFGYILGADDDWPIQRAMHERGLATSPVMTTAPADEWLANLGSMPLVHQPGDVWMYDTALDVLGVLIARVAGQPLETFMRERLFERRPQSERHVVAHGEPSCWARSTMISRSRK